MISTILSVFFPPFIGLYVLYQHQKHNLKQAIRYYIILLYSANIPVAFILAYILKKEFSFGPNFFVFYATVASFVAFCVAKFIVLNKQRFQFQLERSKQKTALYETVIGHFILIIATLLAGGFAYYRHYFTNISLENLFFAFGANLVGTSASVIKSITIYVLIFFVIFYSISAIFIFSHKYNLMLKIDKRKYRLIPIGILAKNKIFGSLFVLMGVLLFAISYLDVFTFVDSIVNPSKIYENHYVDPQTVELSFPEKKKNVIHIMLESMENSVFSEKSGGAFRESVVPELESLALDNISFSPNENIASGLFVPSGCNWTAAGMVCQSAGAGMRYGISTGENKKSFLPGAYPLGRILEKEDYNLKIIMGSDGSFNNRNVYYRTHGNYDVLDLFEAAKEGYIPKGYHNDWWGFEDAKLYEMSKSEISKLAKQNKPFAYTMLTVDTHFPEGYLDESCPNKYSNPYLSSYACASTMLSDFIDWLKAQRFYKDTVVVITGDHLTMQDTMFKGISYNNRYIYNTIINSSIKPETEIRQGSSFDVFPTILASMGVKINGDRLGLGTNLYSDKPTLIDELGLETFKKETRALSNYYIENIAKSPKEGK